MITERLIENTEPIWHRRPCPHCKAAAREKSVVSASFPAEIANATQISNAWRGFFADSCFFSYFRCSECTQLFNRDYLSNTAINKLYSEMEDNTHCGDASLAALTQMDYCRTIIKYLPAAHTYCEIGPDIGLFLKAMRRLYSLNEALLIEPNQAVWSPLSEAAKGLKTNIIPSIAQSHCLIPDNSQDVIVAIHVLDHLLNPTETLAWVRRKLSKKGIAVFVVHDERSLLARIMGKRFPAYCLQHPQLYNANTLKQGLYKEGLEVKKICKTANYFPVNYLLSHVIFALTKKRFSFARPSWPLRLKLGNILAICSKLS